LDFAIDVLDPIQSSVKPEHSKTPSLPENALGNCGTLCPTLRAFASSREIPDPSFLDCGGLTPLWIFPVAALDPIQSSVKPEHSKTPSWPQSVLGNCGTLSPTLRASASPREIPDPSFLDCGGLTPLWIFPSSRSIPIQSSVKPEHSKTPSFPQNVLGNGGTLSPTLRASA
jgi:hypothetical protein